MPSSLVCSGAAAALLLAGTHIAGSPPNVPIAATATLVGAGALAETAEVTYGNTSVTFSAPVSLSAGTVLVFSAEPLATYTLAADIDAGEDGTLTTPYAGTSNLAAGVTTVASPGVVFSAPTTLAPGTLVSFSSEPAVTFAVVGPSPSGGFTLVSPPYGATSGSGVVVTNVTPPALGAYLAALQTAIVEVSSLGILPTTTTTNGLPTFTFNGPVTLPAGTQLSWLTDDPGVVYTLASALVAQTAATLTTAYQGPSDVDAVVSNVTPVLTSPIHANPELVTKRGVRVLFPTKAFGAYAPSDLVQTCPYPDTFRCVGADRQPVLLVAIPAYLLVP